MQKDYAIIITAYNDFDVLLKCLNYYKRYCDVYIHIDKKVSLPKDFLKKITEYTNVDIISTRKVNWGGTGHILAVLDLLKIAVKNQYKRYHILSGNTFVIKPMKEIENALSLDKNYIEIIDALSEALIERQLYFHFMDFFNVKSNRGKKCEEKLLELQKIIGVKRKIEYNYKGYFYCHLTDDFVKYVLLYIKNNPLYLKSLKTIKIPEEIFFQNIIMASPYRETVVNDSLIFSDWESGKGGCPAVLEWDDIKYLIPSKYMFARKIRSCEDVESIIQVLDSM